MTMYDFLKNENMSQVEKIKRLREMTNCDLITARNMVLEYNQNNIPPEQDSSQLCCPSCNSTNIRTGNRGYESWREFLGFGSPKNVCKNCGYKWK